MDKQKFNENGDAIHISCGTPFPSQTRKDSELTADDREMVEGHRNNGVHWNEGVRLYDYSNWLPPQHKKPEQRKMEKIDSKI